MLSLLSSKYFDRLLLAPIDYIINQLKDVDLESDYKPISASEVIGEPKEISIMRSSINDMLTRIGEQSSALLDKQMEISSQYEEIEALYEETTAMNDSLNDSVHSLNESWKQTIRVLSNAIEANDEYTRGHCDRVTTYAVALAKKIKLPQEHISQLELAALLHDVGKVGIPNHILNKEERLTDEELVVIKKHPLIGYNIIQDVPFLKQASQIVLSHHEFYNGEGYPHQIKGEQIPVEARILSVADAFDAMTTARSYRKEPMATEAALHELNKHKGTQFDPMIVDAFGELY
jgi:putative nucleotidyltransferase with HDIG domain